MKCLFAPISLFLVTAALAAPSAGCLDATGSSRNPDSPIDASVPNEDAPSTGGTVTPPGAITISATPTIDFGLTDCGGQPPASQTFSVANTGGTAVHYSLALSPTTVFQIVGATSGDVAPGASGTVTLGAAAVPATETAAQVDQATLTVTTDDPALPSATFTLQRTAQGATFTLAPATVAFGDEPVTATSAPTSLTLTNTGNAAATVTIGAPTDPHFALSGASSPVTLAPNAAVPSLSATFSPTATGTITASSSLTATGAVCGASVTSISFSGNGTNGVVDVTPGTLDFEKVNCGATGAPQIVTVANGGNGSFDFTATLVGGAASPFTLSLAPAGDGGVDAGGDAGAPADAGADAGSSAGTISGTVGAGTSAFVVVTPKKIPSVSSTAANAFGDTLQVTSDAVGDGTHQVTLTETAQGAVLGLSTTSIGFSGVVLDQTSTSTFNVTNGGNLGANITLKATGGAAFSVTPATSTPLAAGATPLQGTAAFKPTALGAQNASVAIQTGASDVLCSAPIGPVGLSGTGINGTLAVSKATLDFLAVPCGQATTAQTFTVNNTGTAPFTWSATLGLGASSPYTVSPASGTQNPTSPATTVTVTPAKIPFPSALTANLYGDTLTITPTGIEGGTAAKVALKETAEGAVITAAPTTVPAFTGQQEGQASAAATLTITNTGTLAATITPTIGGTDPSSFLLATPGAQTLAIGGGHYNAGPTFKPLATGALSAQITLAAGTTDVLCQPLPAAIGLSGTGVNGLLAIASPTVTFTDQNCGAATGQTQTLKLTNNGTGALTFAASVVGATGFKVSPASGSIGSGGASTLLTITSPTFTTAVGNVTAVTDTLKITTDVYGDAAHDVTLSSTPQGAILAWTKGPPSAAFGTVQATSGGTVSKNVPIALVNNGNVSATVTFKLAGATTFTFSPQGTAVGPSGGTLSGDATFAPETVGAQSDTVDVTIPAGTPFCAALPTLPISGTGAAGTFSSATTGLDFSLTCNAAAAGQSFDISNSGTTEPYDFTATVTGTGWTVSPTSGAVAASGSVLLTVTPPAVGSVATGTGNDVNVVVTTDIPGDTGHKFAMDGTTSGAVLEAQNAVSVSPLTTVTLTSCGGAVGASETMANTGNASFGSAGGTYSLLVVPSASNPAGGTLTVTVAEPIAVGNSSLSIEADTSGALGTYTYTVYVVNPDPASGICSAQQSFTVNATFTVC